MEELKARSGKILAKNDDLIKELVLSGTFDIKPDGTILKKDLQGRWLKPGEISCRGYRRIFFKGKRLLVHRIIYAKYGSEPLSTDLVINHKDGNKLNCHIDNLELISQIENSHHSFRDLKRTPSVGIKKITYEIAKEVRRLHQLGHSLPELSLKFALPWSTVYRIIVNRVWTPAVHEKLAA